ncbi:MAG TPA: ATP-binding protein [Mycobacteriales bacterium]|nr:ATP-binding protein [Mycobacteriales bacterium]
MASGASGAADAADAARSARWSWWWRAGWTWWTGRSLRARLTLLATAVLAAGLAAGSALLFGTLQRTEMSTLDAGAQRTARNVAALVNAGRLPDPIPAGVGTAVVQVVDSTGRVRAASANADHLVPMLAGRELGEIRRGERLVVSGDRIGQDDQVRVVGVTAGPPADPQTVVVAVSLRDVRQGLGALRTALTVGLPILLVALAVLGWYVVGLALRPVDALRAGAEEISGTGGSRRLPVPGATDEVHRLATTLNDMLTRLEEASTRQRRFVSDAAHELRSPLASIRTQVEVADRLADWDGVAEGVLDDVRRLSRLVDDLLVLAGLDEARGRPHRRVPVDLAGLARAVAAGHTGGPVPVRVSGLDSAMASGDPDGLRRVLANLVDNAVRHASAAVTVVVGPVDPTWAVVAVCDDGAGIPEAHRAAVFDRFTRLDDARSRQSGGAGLGLAIVGDTVRAHGGTIALEDAGPGLRAVLRLPGTPPASEV